MAVLRREVQDCNIKAVPLEQGHVQQNNTHREQKKHLLQPQSTQKEDRPRRVNPEGSMADFMVPKTSSKVKIVAVLRLPAPKNGTPFFEACRKCVPILTGSKIGSGPDFGSGFHAIRSPVNFLNFKFATTGRNKIREIYDFLCRF